MPKDTEKSRKRQKREAEPEAAKDDEERRLESLLFGVPYTPDGEEFTITIPDDEEDAEEEEDKEMAVLKDSDVSLDANII